MADIYLFGPSGDGDIDMSPSALSVLVAWLGLYQGRIRPANHVPLTGTGEWSMVLGHDLPGQVFTIGDGESITITQTAAFNDEVSVRALGAIRFPDTPLPANWVWRLTFDASGELFSFDLDETVYGLAELEINEDYLGFSVANLAGGDHPLSITLELVYVPGGPIDPIDAELPAVYLDGFLFEEPAAMFLTGRYPEPGDTAVPHTSPTPWVRVVIASNDASAVVLADTQVFVRAVLAYDGGAGGFQAGFSGTVTGPGFGVGATDVLITIDLSAQTFVSEELIDVQVISETVGLSSLDDTWAFTLADIAAPQLDDVTAIEKKVLRVLFNEDVFQADGTASNDALNPANYSFTRQSAPAANIEAVGVTAISAFEVEILLDIEMTFGASYLMTVQGIEDLAGNVITVPGNSIAFIGFTPVTPAGRVFDLWKFIPAVNRREDATRDLERFISVLQESAGLWLSLVDSFTDIIDIDIAPEFYVDLILCDLGNPFKFVLSAVDKRRLARVLVDIYRQKGTAAGVENAIRFFLGLEVACDAFNLGSYWLLGVSELGIDNVLAPSEQFLLYSWQIISAGYQETTVTVTDNDNGDYTIRLNSVDYTYTAAGNTITQIRDELIQAIEDDENLIGLITPVADGSADIVLTGLVGTAFSVSVDAPFVGNLTFVTPIAPTPFTDLEVSIMTDIGNYMKPAHTHLVRVVQPIAPDLIEDWELGVSLLGLTTFLH